MRALLLVFGSLLFLCNAGWSKPLIVAHRGASHDAPENTLPAFVLAWKQGADAIEGDFLLTKDNKIICIHDDSTQRLADLNLVVRQSTLKELRELDVGLWKHDNYKRTKIPTIAEVFATIPQGKKIFVEVNCGPEIIPHLVKEIENSKLNTEQVVLICFKKEVVQDFKKAKPKNKAFWLSNFKKDKEGIWTPSAGSVLATLKASRADGLDSNKNIPDEIARKVMDAGYEWHAWTVNDIATAKKLKALGIHSITTDRPALIKGSL